LKITKRNESDNLKATVKAAPKNCMVLVSPEFAHHYKTVPKDGRTYIVQDPRRPHVQHWTYPDGTYACIGKETRPFKVPGLPLTFHAKQVKGLRRNKNILSRTADEFSDDLPVQRQSDDPPVVCLIDIKRVIRICGFKKSFIYEQIDFPAPVRLGTSRRSSVRWIESEVVQWVSDLAAKRITSPPNKSAQFESATLTSGNRSTATAAMAVA